MSEVKYRGKIIEVVEERHGNKIFEKARRTPGVRALIVNNGKILISREFRTEVGDYDYRLPGGKVFDTLAEFSSHANEDLTKFANEAVVKECYEEVGLKIRNPKLIKISKAGATVSWDLYYYEIKDFVKDKQHLEDGEDISFAWYSVCDVLKLCTDNKISEDRSVGVLLNYILQNFQKELSDFCDKSTFNRT